MGTPQGISLAESLHPFAFLVSEDSDGSGYLSRDTVTIGAGQTLPAGQVLGAKALTTLVPASTAGANTGNGALTLANPGVTAQVLPGNYRIVFTDATHFLVEDPAHNVLGEGVAGTAWTKHVLFTIAAGGTAFAAGDTFLVNVDETLATEVYVAWNPAATDGSERATAILGYGVTTGASATAQAVVINTHATVRLADLTWNASATAAQIDDARRRLEGALIKFR